jgi:hypothetical protein
MDANLICKWQHSGDLRRLRCNPAPTRSPYLVRSESSLIAIRNCMVVSRAQPSPFISSIWPVAAIVLICCGATIEVPIFRVQKRSGIQLRWRAQRRSTTVIGSIRLLSRLRGPCCSHITQITTHLSSPKVFCKSLNTTTLTKVEHSPESHQRFTLPQQIDTEPI